MSRRTLFLSAAVLCALCVSGRAAEPKLTVTANRTQIYLGESVLLTVKVANLAHPPEPDLSRIPDCTVRFRDSQSQNYQQITIVNGRMQKESFYGRVFTYELTPSRAGRFKAGPVLLHVDGKTLESAGPFVEVAGIEDQDVVRIEVKPSRESVLVAEPFEIRLRVAVRRLPGRYDKIEPFDPDAPPLLQVPYLDKTEIPGLQVPDIRSLLRQRLLPQRKPGFAINHYTVRADPSDVRSLFDLDMLRDEVKATFGLERRTVGKNGRSYFEYGLDLRYVPEKEGSYTFGPVLFKGPILTAVDAAGAVERKAVFAVGPACTVRVIPPPEEGRPPSYIGAIGTDLAVEASLDTQTCNVGDPLTLTLAVSGDISLENLSAPPLNLQTNLTRDFRIYEDTVRTVTEDDRKSYRYTIRPTAAGTIEFPPVAISYFDTRDRAYRTIRTRALPVRAYESKEVAGDMIIAAATNRRDRAGTARPGPESTIPAPLNVDPAGAEPAQFLTGTWPAVTAGSAPLAYLLVLAGLRLHRSRPDRQAARKRRRARRVAERRLRGIAGGSRGGEAPSEIYAVLRDYLADRLGVSAAGMTPADVAKLLERAGLSPSRIDRFRSTIEDPFDRRYEAAATQGPGVSEECRAVRELIRETEAALSRQADLAPGGDRER